MDRKSITTSHAVLACDVCGRTLLRGERADAFIAGGSRRLVCELCIGRATNEGWIREGADDTSGMPRNGARGGRSLLGRLRQRRDGAAERRAARLAQEPPPEAYEPAPAAAPDLHASVAAEPAPAAPARPAYEPPREPRHVRAVPTNAELKMSRALDVFNVSEHPRTVAGVARSLGPPVVAVLPSQTEGAIVTIVVSWELCWYRYEVDLADESAGVRLAGQGQELSELSGAEQQPNAAADERGTLVLAS
jgi:hypothetical protein